MFIIRFPYVLNFAIIFIINIDSLEAYTMYFMISIVTMHYDT